jgi:hypothetical protein
MATNTGVDDGAPMRLFLHGSMGDTLAATAGPYGREIRRRAGVIGTRNGEVDDGLKGKSEGL